MLSRFYEANPSYADKTILMVKVSVEVIHWRHSVWLGLDP